MSRDKVYCCGCKHLLKEWLDVYLTRFLYVCTCDCNMIYKDTAFSREQYFPEIAEANKNNDCKYFESK